MTPSDCSTPPVATSAQANAETAPPVQVDRVYVSAPRPRQTITVHKVAAAGGGESEGAEEGD